MSRTYTIREYDSFTRGKIFTDEEYLAFTGRYCPIDEQTFDALEEFILGTEAGTEADPAELLSLRTKKGFGKIISAKNYVGVITLKNGAAVEILPKICSAHGGDIAARRLFCEMLAALDDAPCKNLGKSSLQAEYINIFEIFVRDFTDDCFKIVKEGLCSFYVPETENLPYMRGRLLISRHIAENAAHRERFYVCHDLFDTNTPENRLIKAALLYLKTKPLSAASSSRIDKLLSSFERIPPSVLPEHDLNLCRKGRDAQRYAGALRWCRIFLRHKSLTVFKGAERASAMLFPMEKLFEGWAAQKITNFAGRTGLEVSTQKGGSYLFDDPQKFALIPDITITQRKTGRRIVIDTKWKLLSPELLNLGLSVHDLYQMYVYHKKYETEKAVLLFPAFGNERAAAAEHHFACADGTRLELVFIDMGDTESGFEKLFCSITQTFA
ncbi:MAG: hypothetical protein RRY12_10930 [Cloacibacillus sp.]